MKESISSSNDSLVWVNPIIGLFFAQMIGGLYWSYIGNKYGKNLTT